MPHRKQHINKSGADEASAAFSGITIPEIVSGYIKEQDMDDWPDAKPREKKILVAMSKLEQWSDWQTDSIAKLSGAIETLSENVRELVRREESRDKEQAKHGWVLAMVKWCAVSVGAALIATLFRMAFK